MGFDKLSTLLWRERDVLDLLGFKLAEEYLVLAAGHHAWLARATAEVEQAVGLLADADHLRERAVAELVVELGLDATPTLAELADLAAAPEPWRELLAGHRQAMLDHLAHIERVSAANREILARRMTATADALAYLGAQPGSSYGPDGNPPTLRANARLVNATA
ncbi:MAG TPA: flagellar protein FlgN [Acidimicrobiales bacterium]|nr:flagellar protein FlgN [Acidimicrobiales bacterium]